MLLSHCNERSSCERRHYAKMKVNHSTGHDDAVAARRPVRSNLQLLGSSIVMAARSSRTGPPAEARTEKLRCRNLDFERENPSLCPLRVEAKRKSRLEGRKGRLRRVGANPQRLDSLVDVLQLGAVSQRARHLPARE